MVLNHDILDAILTHNDVAFTLMTNLRSIFNRPRGCKKYFLGPQEFQKHILNIFCKSTLGQCNCVTLTSCQTVMSCYILTEKNYFIALRILIIQLGALSGGSMHAAPPENFENQVSQIG